MGMVLVFWQWVFIFVLAFATHATPFPSGIPALPLQIPCPHPVMLHTREEGCTLFTTFVFPLFRYHEKFNFPAEKHSHCPYSSRPNVTAHLLREREREERRENHDLLEKKEKTIPYQILSNFSTTIFLWERRRDSGGSGDFGFLSQGWNCSG